MSMAVERDAHGRITRGTPNPGGRPRGLERVCREVVGTNGGYEKIFQFLADVCIGRLSTAAKIADRIRAAEILMERGHGRPKQELQITGDGEAAQMGRFTIAQLTMAQAILVGPPEVAEQLALEDGKAQT